MSHRDNVNPTREKPLPLLSVTLAPEAAVVAAIEPEPPFALYVICGLVVHTANSITGEVMVNVSPSTYEVPVPSAFVFHPEKTLDVRVIVPLLPTTVTVSPTEYGVEPSIGAFPDV